MTMPKPSKKKASSAGAALSPKEVHAERVRLGVPGTIATPADGFLQRSWIRYQLQIRGWSQAKIARATFASESTVSVIYTGQRPAGHKADRVRRITAEVLGVREDVLFPEAKVEYERRAHDRVTLLDARREKARKRKRAERARARAVAVPDDEDDE